MDFKKKVVVKVYVARKKRNLYICANNPQGFDNNAKRNKKHHAGNIIRGNFLY